MAYFSFSFCFYCGLFKEKIYNGHKKMPQTMENVCGVFFI